MCIPTNIYRGFREVAQRGVTSYLCTYGKNFCRRLGERRALRARLNVVSGMDGDSRPSTPWSGGWAWLVSDKGERGGDDIRTNEPHRVVAKLKGKRSVVEQRNVCFGHTEIPRKLPLEPLQHRAIVRQPLVCPYLLAPLLEVFNRGQVWTSD